jgi:hypothetical protein
MPKLDFQDQGRHSSQDAAHVSLFLFRFLAVVDADTVSHTFPSATPTFSWMTQLLLKRMVCKPALSFFVVIAQILKTLEVDGT